MELKDLNTAARPTWCPGCGNFGIWNALKRAIIEYGRPKDDTVIVGGVGCSGKIPHWVNTYGFHGLHGRTLPVATGIKLANQQLNVIAEGGDGDGYDEGMSHLIHACRRNVNVTYVVHNNQVFGLTKGQTSPTADLGYRSATTPWGSREMPINPLALTISAHATFVARGFAADMPHLVSLLKRAMAHEGFAIVDILQPCITFNHLNTYDWYNKRVYKIGPDEKGRGKHDAKDRVAALTRALEWGDEGIPIGVLYEEQRHCFGCDMPQLKKTTLVNKNIDNINITPLEKKYY